MRHSIANRQSFWRKLILAVAASAASVIPLLSQTVSEKKPSFEVASVKPNTSGPGRTAIGVPGCRFAATNATLRMLVQFAYGPQNGQLPNNRIVGGPSWMDADRFDVQGKPEGDTRPIPAPEMQLMVQSLLEDRFQLKAHRETRELPVYDLVVGKNGAKIKLSEDQTPPQRVAAPLSSCAPQPPPPPPGTPPPGGPRGAAPMPRGGSRLIAMPGPAGITLTLTAGATPLSDLANLLQSYAGRPIMDKTGLNGLFDVKLEFGLEALGPALGPDGAAPGPVAPVSSDPSGPSLFTAIQDQLGLKLEPSKGHVEVLVIDGVQKPSEN